LDFGIWDLDFGIFFFMPGVPPGFLPKTPIK